MDPDLDRLAAAFRELAATECSDLPLYRRVIEGAADDPDVLAVLRAAPAGQQRPVLLLAAVHAVLLSGVDHPLAAWYPTTGGTRRATDGDPYRAFRDLVLDDEAVAVRQLVATRTTQTNEVNRSCLWFAALRVAADDEAGRPIVLVELGASAGLNLLVDRYEYDFGRGPLGAIGSPVRLACEVRSGTPPLDGPLPPIAARAGLDVDPLDVRDDRATTWLRACVWPEQRVRHERLDAALAMARLDPPPLVRADAVDGWRRLVDDLPADAHLVVVNSWALTYLPRDRRSMLLDELDATGSTRSLSWVSAEHGGCLDVLAPLRPEGVPEGATLAALTTWRSGRRSSRLLAVVHPHLAWMDWRA